MVDSASGRQAGGQAARRLSTGAVATHATHSYAVASKVARRSEDHMAKRKARKVQGVSIANDVVPSQSRALSLAADRAKHDSESLEREMIEHRSDFQARWREGAKKRKEDSLLFSRLSQYNVYRQDLDCFPGGKGFAYLAGFIRWYYGVKSDVPADGPGSYPFTSAENNWHSLRKAGDVLRGRSAPKGAATATVTAESQDGNPATRVIQGLTGAEAQIKYLAKNGVIRQGYTLADKKRVLDALMTSYEADHKAETARQQKMAGKGAKPARKPAANA